MRITKWITISLIALTFSFPGASRVSAEDGDGTTLRWDIFQFENVTATSPTIAAGGTVTGTGTYRVTELVFFQLGAGTLAGAPFIDALGNLNDTRAGLADGGRCH